MKSNNVLAARATALAVVALVAGCGVGGGKDNLLVLAHPDQACAGVAAAMSSGTTKVDSATYITTGFNAPDGTAKVSDPFCRVTATSRPSSDSDIKFELWMPPVTKWNGRFLAVGGSGNSGSIIYASMATGLTQGYAVLSTDNGHVGMGQIFAVGHPEKVIDFGNRAQPVTATAGKAMTNAFYGQPAKKSYWLGCSQGGGKGMMQSQRYPDVYDGIVAGSPVFDWVGSQFSAPWVDVKGMRDATKLVPKAKLPAIHQAVLNACDGVDGLTDGLIQEPKKCKFDPASMACPAGSDSNSCLTPGQVESMKRYYAPVTRQNGQQIYAAYALGSEGNSAWLGATAPRGNWAGFWPNVVYENPAYSIVQSLDVDTDKDYNFAKTKLATAYDAVSTDLSAYNARGGKLLIWQGLNDASVTPYQTQDYIDAVRNRYGVATSDTFLKAFFAPGVNHCGSGEGPEPDQFDMLSSMVNWVENGVAPQTVLASHKATSGAVDRTMPLCPYPQVARYKGTGDKNAAANYACGS